MTPGEMLFWLLVGHAVADYPLQGDFLARAKNHRAAIAGVPAGLALWSHALIHAGAVMLVTGSLGLALLELLLHAGIDWLKCDRRLGPDNGFAFGIDQALHVLSKLVILTLYFVVLP